MRISPMSYSQYSGFVEPSITRSPKLSPERIALLNSLWNSMQPSIRVSVTGFEIENAINIKDIDSSFSNKEYKIFYQHKLPNEIYY